jgi:hypothetical protein
MAFPRPRPNLAVKITAKSGYTGIGSRTLKIVGLRGNVALGLIWQLKT